MGGLARLSKKAVPTEAALRWRSQFATIDQRDRALMNAIANEA
jgi:hypothetical protein